MESNDHENPGSRKDTNQENNYNQRDEVRVAGHWNYVYLSRGSWEWAFIPESSLLPHPFCLGSEPPGGNQVLYQLVVPVPNAESKAHMGLDPISNASTISPDTSGLGGVERSSDTSGLGGVEWSLRPRDASSTSDGGCTGCKRRKIKCDEKHPTCSGCARRGVLCKWAPSQTATTVARTLADMVEFDLPHRTQSPTQNDYIGSTYTFDAKRGQRGQKEISPCSRTLFSGGSKEAPLNAEDNGDVDTAV